MKQTALITGSSSGIGLAVLEQFISEGIFVIGTYNSNRSIADELIQKHGVENLIFYKFDQSSPNSIQELLNNLPDKLDILVNNAGLGSKKAEEITNNKFEQDIALMHTNSLGPLWLTRSIIGKKLSLRKVINISSVGGGIFHFSGFKYADGMSKAAISFLTKQLAAENIYSEVDVFAICPGATDTKMFNGSSLSDLSDDERNQYISNLPKGRLIQPSEIAKLCSYLIRPEAQILHGANIDASMGLGVKPGVLD